MNRRRAVAVLVALLPSACSFALSPLPAMPPAGAEPPVALPRLSAAFVPDGKLDEWKDSAPIRLDRREQITTTLRQHCVLSG